MKLKPILVSTDDKHSRLDIDPQNDNKLSAESEQYHHKNPQHIILVDTEAEIVEGDLCAVALWDYECEVVDKSTVDMINAEMLHNGHVKIISSTNKSHSTSQLSNNSIQLLINYYNEHKCMPESVDVKHKLGRSIGDDIISATWERQYGTDTMRVGVKDIVRIAHHKKKYDQGTAIWVLGFDENDKVIDQFGDSRTIGKYSITVSKTIFTRNIKLNQQGEVDITILESKTYTEEKVREAFKAGSRRGYSQRSIMAGCKGTNEPDEDEWVNSNKK